MLHIQAQAREIIDNALTCESFMSVVLAHSKIVDNSLMFANELLAIMLDDKVAIPPVSDTMPYSDRWRYKVLEIIVRDKAWKPLLDKIKEVPAANLVSFERATLVAMIHIYKHLVSVDYLKMETPAIKSGGERSSSEVIYELENLYKHKKNLEDRGLFSSAISVDSGINEIESLYKYVYPSIADRYSSFPDEARTAIESAIYSLDPIQSGISDSFGLPCIRKLSGIGNIAVKDAVFSTKTCKNIIDMMGRMEASYTPLPKQKSKKRVRKVEYGNDISRLLPDELLKDDYLFYKEFADQSLLQYAEGGTSGDGRGPIIVVLDESASMRHAVERLSADINPTTRATWAKGFTLVIQKQGIRQKRNVYIVGFGEAIKYKFSLNNPTLEQMDTLINKGVDDGTNFAQPLRESIEIIRQNNKYKNADIVFITDGQDNDLRYNYKLLEEYKKIKSDLKFKCYGILIGGDKYNPGALGLIADSIISISKLADTSNLADIVNSL